MRPMPDADRNVIHAGAAIVTSLAAGIIWWMIYLAGPRVDETWSPLVVGGCATILLGALFPGAESGRIGFGFVAGPFVLATWTASRGDGDGLWALVFPMLIVVGAGGTLLAGYGATLRRRIFGTSGSRHPSLSVVGGVTIAALVMVAGGVVTTRWPSPWEHLEAAMDRVAVATDLVRLSEERFGDPLCTRSCGPSLIREYRTVEADSSYCGAIDALIGSGPRPGGSPCAAQITIDVDGPRRVTVAARFDDDQTIIAEAQWAER